MIKQIILMMITITATMKKIYIEKGRIQKSWIGKKYTFPFTRRLRELKDNIKNVLILARGLIFKILPF